jgi:hypothetical protein
MRVAILLLALAVATGCAQVVAVQCSWDADEQQSGTDPECARIGSRS